MRFQQRRFIWFRTLVLVNAALAAIGCWPSAASLERSRGADPQGPRAHRAGDDIVELRPQAVQIVTSDPRYIDEWPAPSPDGATILFARVDTARGERMRLWSVSAKGGTPRRFRMPDVPLDVSRPSWSRDGKWIAFSASIDEDREYAQTGIWVMNVATREALQVTDPRSFTDIYAQWLPGNGELVVMRSRQGDRNRDLWRISRAGSAIGITTNSGFDVSRLSHLRVVTSCFLPSVRPTRCADYG